MAKPVANVGEAIQDWSRDIEKVFGVAPMTAITRAAGIAGQKSAKVAARSATGGDMRLSGLPKAKLTVSLSPIKSAGRAIFLELGATGWSGRGLWKLADTGRSTSGIIRPTTARAKRLRVGSLRSLGKGGLALRFPDGGYRTRSRYKPQRKSPMAKEKAVAAARTAASVAARKQLISETRKITGGKKNVYRTVMR